MYKINTVTSRSKLSLATNSKFSLPKLQMPLKRLFFQGEQIIDNRLFKIHAHSNNQYFQLTATSVFQVHTLKMPLDLTQHLLHKYFYNNMRLLVFSLRVVKGELKMKLKEEQGKYRGLDKVYAC